MIKELVNLLFSERKSQVLAQCLVPDNFNFKQDKEKFTNVVSSLAEAYLEYMRTYAKVES